MRHLTFANLSLINAMSTRQRQPHLEVLDGKERPPSLDANARAREQEDAGVVAHGEGARDEEWTIQMCTKRLSMLHRKLRQVKELCVKQARDPDSLDAAQLLKIGRKDSLQVRW